MSSRRPGSPALDLIIDALIDGRDVVVTVLDAGQCLHPDHTPLTSYREGCRCERCRVEHNAQSAVHAREWVRTHGGRWPRRGESRRDVIHNSVQTRRRTV